MHYADITYPRCQCTMHGRSVPSQGHAQVNMVYLTWSRYANLRLYQQIIPTSHDLGVLG